MSQIECEECKETVPDYDIIHCGSPETGYRDLCSHCFNEEIACKTRNAEFTHERFEPVEMLDHAGNRHTFHFQTHLLGDKVSLRAFELQKGYPSGYQFQILGDPEEDTLALLGRLVQKARRGLSTQYLTEGSLGLQIADSTMCGRIEWDENASGRLPLMVVDGREIDWEDFGEMLMAFEGWQFKLEIVDPSDEA